MARDTPLRRRLLSLRPCPVTGPARHRPTGRRPSYLGIFAIDVVANGADEIPPSLLAFNEQTSGWPASAFATR